MTGRWLASIDSDTLTAQVRVPKDHLSFCNGFDEALNRLRRREPFTDAEAELISQRSEAMRRYLERLAEKVRRLEAGGE